MELIQITSSSVSTPRGLLLNTVFTSAPAPRLVPDSTSPDKSLIKVSTITITCCNAHSAQKLQHRVSNMISKVYERANTADSGRRITGVSNGSTCWKARLLSGFCNAVDWLIDGGHTAAHARDHVVDELGNFAPVESESAPEACQLEEGRLPEFLEGGAYVRNGPNERYPLPDAAQHLFDGDGMLHAVTFRDAADQAAPATYCCRYTRTSRFLQEDAAGRALFPKIFGASRARFLGMARFALALLRVVSGLVDFSQGTGLANSGVVFHHRKLLALSEDDLPHEVQLQPDGDLATVGRYTFMHGGRESAPLASLWATTTHPKIDPRTGEMLAFGYNPLFAPYLTYFRVSEQGVCSKGIDVHMEEPCMMHDFAATEHFVVFPDVQVVFRPPRILIGRSPVVCDARKTPRLGVLPRAAEDGSGIRWFDVPGCNCLHFLNAWEEEDVGGGKELVLIVTAVAPVDLHVLLGDLQSLRLTLLEVRLNVATGRVVSQTPICSSSGSGGGLNLEMGTINRNFLGRPNRFLYMGVAGRLPSLAGIVKVDVRSRKVLASRSFSTHCSYASEPLFVPATSSTSDSHEDHGCVLCLVHHEPTQTTRLLVLDPLHLHTLASIKLPRRVPYGFHGVFVSKEDLAHHHS